MIDCPVPTIRHPEKTTCIAPDEEFLRKIDARENYVRFSPNESESRKSEKNRPLDSPYNRNAHAKFECAK